MPDGVIPPSPYPVLQESRKPTRYIDGPYIASRPAYQIFADQARTGASIGDMIASDVRSQAKAEGRPDPVKEMPENRQFWFHDGEMEPIPEWPNANSPPKAAPAPAAPPAPLIAPPLAPAPAPAAHSSAPAAPSSVPAASSSAPAGPAPTDAAAPAVASTARVGSRRPTASAAPSQPASAASPEAAAGRSAARRPIGAARASAVQQQLAAASYPRPSRQERLAQRAAARNGDPRAV